MVVFLGLGCVGKLFTFLKLKMKRTLQIILILIPWFLNAQLPDNFFNEFLLDDELQSENKIDKYYNLNFASIWTKKNDEEVYGIIGEEHQRLRIKFLSIFKNPFNETEYIVYGKSMVKETICEFSGVIKLLEIKEVKELHFGVDAAYKDSSIVTQGILKAKFEFLEFKPQSHSGKFTGYLLTKWYLTKTNQPFYDDIQSISDGYMNNAFIGYWTQFDHDKSKVCNWADFRVPLANKDFDIGAGEFSVSKKYWNNGWMDIALKQNTTNLSIKSNKTPKKTKEWWK